MHQTFQKLSETEQTPARIERLREQLVALSLDGVIVPRSDEFQNEYVPASAERLRWLTGFSGSAGLAIILANKGAIFVDGRYVLQVETEVNTGLLTPLQIPQNDPAAWLAEAIPGPSRIGFDPRLHGIRSVENWMATLKDKNPDCRLVALDDNPVDAIWFDRPAPPATPVRIHPKKFAGVTSKQKIADRQAALIKAGLEAFVITDPASVDWLFNIRGNDVPHTPLSLAYAILYAERTPELIIDPAKLDTKTAAKLSEDCELQPFSNLKKRLKKLKKAGGRIGLDPASASYWFQQLLTGKRTELVKKPDPCQLPRAIKNSTEISGMRKAHIRDGVAVSRFLCWLQQTATPENIDEISAAQKLEAFRAESSELMDISFETISGAGANGAIVHYRVNDESNRPLEQNTLYLVDSGGQYRDGTTDITRTVVIGKPTDEMRRHYTLVLKGHVALASARFPKGSRGVDLDILARNALWRAGLDYDHGTGHGVGAYLGVHEGPQNISKRGMAELLPGMIISNEPGYYKTGSYGIRIESLVLVKPAEIPDGGERPMLGFETLTQVPFDRRLIDRKLLDASEIEWIDAYHAHVKRMISPHLETAAEKRWLEESTKPLARS